MLDWTLHQWLVVAIPVTAVVIAVLAWRRPRHPKSDRGWELKNSKPYQVKEFPEIHATSGVPTLPQFTEGMHLDAKRSLLAQRRYGFGLAQFNHYVNNRDGVIEESRRQMANLAGSLSQIEKFKAEEIGESLATFETSEQEEEAQAHYKGLSVQAQIYAQHRRREIEAMRRIARDLETNTSRTDYTSVKARIASGNVKLDPILSELPIAWQDIRTLSERAIRPKITGKPPKLERIQLLVITRDRGLLKDHRAEIDGKWVVSEKLDITVPYKEPAPIYEQVEEGVPPVWKGEAVVITDAPESESVTEFWRKGGRLDELYTRYRDGKSPDQLRSAQRWRRIIMVALVLEFALTMAFVLLWSNG